MAEPWEEVFRRFSPGAPLPSVGQQTPALTVPAVPQLQPQPQPQMQGGLLPAIGRAFHAGKRQVDILTNRLAGLPDAEDPIPSGELLKEALFPSEAHPTSIIKGTPLELIPGLTQVGAMERAREAAQKVGPEAEQAVKLVEAPMREAYGFGADLLTDPLLPVGIGPLARIPGVSRAVALGFGGAAGLGALRSGREALQEGFTPEGLGAGTRALLEAGLAGAGLGHGLVSRPKLRPAPGVKPIPERAQAAPAPVERRAGERRAPEESMIPSGQRTGIDRRQAIRQEFPDLPEPVVERIASAEERVSAAEVDSITGLPGRIVYERDRVSHKGGFGSLDVAGLGWVNDNLGHPAGDSFLKALGDAVKEEPGVRVYRVGGDEFGILADTPESARAAGQSIQDRFKQARFEAEHPDGTKVEYTGGRVDYGAGESFREADVELYREREAARLRGERASAKGLRPPGLVEVPAPRVEASGDIAAQAAARGPEPGTGAPESTPSEAPGLVPPQPPPRVIRPIPPGTPPGGEVEALRSLVEQARPIRQEQEALYSQERGRRFGAAGEALQAGRGEASFVAARGELKGELPKAAFEPIRQHLKPEQVDNLYEHIKVAPLTSIEQVRTGEALRKILDPQAPVVPQSSELALLERAFGPELTAALEGKRPTPTRLKEAILSILNAPRTAVASVDMSAPLRQGLILTVAHPVKASSAFGNMLRAYFSPKHFDRVKQEILTRPTADTHNEAGLYISMKQGGSMAGREEAFMSRLLHKVPGVKASERAYSTYLDKLRADVFDQSLAAFKGGGQEVTPQLLKSLATYINHATGRGSLGALETSAPLLNTVFFSPRFMASRLQFFNPQFWAKLDPVVRKQAVGDLANLAGAGIGLLSIAKLGGADVQMDPRSSDFGKIRIGRVRLDPWGGFQQWLRFFAQMATGERLRLDQRVKEETRLDIATRFGLGKLSPQAAITVDLLRGKPAYGQPRTIGEEAYERLAPIVVRDIWEMIQKEPDLAALVAPFSFFGGGVGQYDEPTELTPSERFLEPEFKRLGYHPGDPQDYRTIQGHQIALTDDEQRVMRKHALKASDEARRLIRSSSYRGMSDEKRELALKRIYDRWRARGFSVIRPQVMQRYRQIPERRRAGPPPALGG